MLEMLEKIGLTRGESEVYLALIELGPSNAGSIIKKANIASSKVYSVLHRLISKGLANYIIKNGVRYYDATPPERLIDFLEEKRSNLKEAQKEIAKFIPEIQARRNSTDKNNVVVYSGIQGPKIVLKEAIEAGKAGEQLLGYGTDDDPYTKYLLPDLQRHFDDQRKFKIKWKLIFSKHFKSPNPLADIRYLPSGFVIPIRTMIYGTKVAIVDFNKPFTTVIIEKKEIAESYKKHFDFLWSIAKKDRKYN